MSCWFFDDNKEAFAMVEKIRENIEIVNLTDAQEYLDEVSRWIWEEWTKADGVELDKIIYRSRHSINRDSVPQMYIAKENDQVVGVVSLWICDLSTRQDLYPWLATLYVKENCSNRGIGSLLQEKCIEATRQMGYKTLYLITHLENYYEKMGWKFVEEAPSISGETEKIYRYDLK